MPGLRDSTFQRISELMRDTVGVSFTESKRALVFNRLSPRIQKLGLRGFDDYLTRVSDDDRELQVAIDLLTTNETYFFREPAHYALLEKEIVSTRPRSLRVWSAAASYGDEAYSLAMLLSDLEQFGHVGSDWSVLGTDISDRVLRGAVDAVFPEERLRHVTPARLKRYCLRGQGESEGLVQMRPELREHVRFGWLNLCAPIEDVGPFDVVFLRNVLIYFDAETKREVVDRVLTQLRPGGLFFIGIAEGRVPGARAVLEPLAPGAFRKG